MEASRMEDMEAKFIANGRAYGYEAKDLRDFVEARMKEALEREERAVRREEVKRENELQAKLKELEERFEKAAVGSEADGSVDRQSLDGRRERRAVIKMPKYDGKQSVASYLELFEDVAEQNGFEDAERLIRLRVALAGSNLERSCYGCKSYADAKRELFLAHGMTGDRAWKKLVTLEQAAEESFFQFVVRVARAAELWSKLSLNSEEPVDEVALYNTELEDMDETLKALVKQVVLEACSPELKAFLIERKCYGMTIKKFQDAGMSYQDAHGRKCKKPVMGPVSSRSSSSGLSTTQCLHISVAEAEKMLESLPKDKRQELLMSKRLCFNCLQAGHRASGCRSKSKCHHCSRKHHSLLHVASEGRAGMSPADVSTQGKSQEAIGTYGFNAVSKSRVQLMTAVAEVKGSHLAAKVRVFLDPGAQASFVTSKLVQAIQPKMIGVEIVKVKAFGTKAVSAQLRRHEIQLTGASKVLKIQAWERDSLELEFDPVETASLAVWKARGYELSDQPEKGTPQEVHLLIGADYCNELLRSMSVIDGQAIWDTEIGWIVSGPSSQHVGTQATSVACISANIEKLWQMDEPLSQGQREPEFPLSRVDNRYQVGLLWKTERRPADNYARAMAAAKHLLEKLERNGKREMYDSVLIDEYKQLGAIELEPNPDEPGYYVPHHGVFRNQATTTKLRVVFNASAPSCDGQSLNDMVYPGPSLLPNLTGMLLRFREYPHAIQADIRKAFFMVAVNAEDRPFLRFLWPGQSSSDEMLIWRLTKLPFGVNCSPYILTAVVQHHLEDLRATATPEQQEFIDLLLKSFYVDDFVSSLQSQLQVERIQQYGVSALSSAGMELRKWRGNSIPCDDEAGAKVLGVEWCPQEDVINALSVTDCSVPDTWSRRSLLRCVASVFDPLGLAAPAVLPGKLLLQESWKLGGEWDDELPTSITAACAQWWGEVTNLRSLQSDRWIGCVSESPIELHAFADASEKGYGCAIYAVVGQDSAIL